MKPTAAAGVTRVMSLDGAEIAYWTSGQGPSLVLVHGAPADHTRFDPLLPWLEPHFTVHAMDRRGRGGSGDGPDYRLAREFEDVAAVVDAVAARVGQQVDLYGHSFGGLCAYGGAVLSSNVRRLVLYEGWPPVDPHAHAFPPAVDEHLGVLATSGDGEAILEIVFRELAGLTQGEYDAMRRLPSWAARLEAAPLLVREIRAIAEVAFDATQAARITVPTLLIVGGDSADPAVADVETIAAALPDARIAVLGGQGHVGDILAPKAFAERLHAFLHP